jgi:hypothetical protein
MDNASASCGRGDPQLYKETAFNYAAESFWIAVYVFSAVAGLQFLVLISASYLICTKKLDEDD